MRQANLELLRLIAMFLVLVVHAAFFSLGTPKADLIRMAPMEQTLITFAEAISIICVNVFILISGWFGIKPKWKSLSNFLFQVFFFLFGIYFLMLVLGQATFSVKGILGCLTITRLNWFIKVYLSLYLISPVLNAFVAHADRRTFKWVLVAFYALQTLYGWTGLVAHYQDGYSTISFIGLYLLARYLHVYRPSIACKSLSFYLSVYLVCVLLLTVLTIGPAFLPVPDAMVNALIHKLYTYINPIVIVEALAFFFLFEKMRVTPRYQSAVNKLAASSFAVFLLHTNPNIIQDVYQRGVRTLYAYTGSVPLNLLYLLGFIFLFFFAAILIDQIRIYIWKLVGGRVEQVLSSRIHKMLD